MVNQAPETQLERHPILYYDDGDIELSAQTTDRSSTRLFKVYRAVLCRKSHVFRDMLIVSGGDRHEVIQMPDSAEDLSALLQCLFDGWYVL